MQYLTDLAFFSANIQKLLPHLPLKDHHRLFQEATAFNRLATDRELNKQALQFAPKPTAWFQQLKKPGVIASFHTGPYRLLSMWLMQQRIPFTLVVSEDVEEKQGHANRQLHQQIVGAGMETYFQTLTAQDPLVLRKMLRALQQGHFILLYLDGNTGAGLQKGTHVLSFLQQPLRVRTGAAALSFLAKAPIYPVLPCFDNNGQPDVLYWRPIWPDNGAKRDHYINIAMRELYSMLEQLIKKYPMQWEGWFYVHDDLVLADNPSINSFFNHYMPFSWAGNYFLLHKASYQAYPLKKPVFDKICRRFLDIAVN